MLPFIAGVAAGVTAILVFNNKKQIEKALFKGAAKAKEIATEAKESIAQKVDCLKSKDEEHPPKKEETTK